MFLCSIGYANKVHDYGRACYCKPIGKTKIAKKSSKVVPSRKVGNQFQVPTTMDADYFITEMKKIIPIAVRQTYPWATKLIFQV